MDSTSCTPDHTLHALPHTLPRAWPQPRTVLLVALSVMALQGCGFLRSLSGREAPPEEAQAPTTAASTTASTPTAAEGGTAQAPSSGAFACKTCRTLSAAPKGPTDVAAKPQEPSVEKPVAASAAATAAPAEPVAVSAPVSMAAPTTPPPEAKPAPLPAAPLPAAPPLPVAKEAAPAALGAGYYINVGLFAIASNGTRAQQKLQGAHMPVLLDTVSSEKGTLTRVRVGPFESKAKANAAAKTIRGLKLEARVFKH